MAITPHKICSDMSVNDIHTLVRIRWTLFQVVNNFLRLYPSYFEMKNILKFIYQSCLHDELITIE